MPAARRNLGRRRYRYTCRLSGFLAVNGYCPKRNGFGFQTTLTHPSAQGVVGVGPSFFRAIFFEDFRFNQLVMQIVEIVLHFAVGQFSVDQVAEVVVVIAAVILSKKVCV